MPAEFFHPAVSASQKGQQEVVLGALPKIALQGSWASLRSPGLNCNPLGQVQPPTYSFWGHEGWGWRPK